MTSKRRMELRDAIILSVTFLAITLGNKYDVSVPDWANEFFEASDGTVRSAIVVVGMFLLRVVGRNNEIVDKILHFGNVFPEQEIEHSGAEKLIEYHIAVETGGAITDIEEQPIESDQIVEAFDVGASAYDEQDDYADWAIDVLQSLGQ